MLFSEYRWTIVSEFFKTIVENAHTVLSENPTKNWKLWGLKLRGLRRNQISTANFIYQNDQRDKINTLGDFENEAPTHTSAIHAFSKICGKFQNRIPGESSQNFDISKIFRVPNKDDNFVVSLNFCLPFTGSGYWFRKDIFVDYTFK